jgi:cyclase
MRYPKSIFVTFAALLSFTALATVVRAQQQAPAPAAPLKVMPLTPYIYWTLGGGGNTGFIISNNGVIVIDAKTTPESGKELVDAIAKVTPKPITTVIITHSDRDHVNGLASFPTGLTIIAMDKCKDEMEASNNVPNPRDPAPKDHMPNKLVTKNEENLTIDGVHLRLLHYAPAHTSGDLIVYLPDQKIVFTGDIVTLQVPFPLIHAEKQGTSEGWITTMKAILALDAETFVPGHGDVQTSVPSLGFDGKDLLRKRLANTEERRAKIADLVKQGKSLDEIKTALGETEAARGGTRFPTFTEVVYQELTKKSAVQPPASNLYAQR